MARKRNCMSRLLLGLGVAEESGRTRLVADSTACLMNMAISNNKCTQVHQYKPRSGCYHF